MSAWASWVSTSSWLQEVGADYGVSTTSAPVSTIVIPGTTAPGSASDTSIQADLTNRIGSGVLPAPDANTLYMLFFPSTTMLTGILGAVGCQAFSGYHSSFTLASGTPVTYAIVADCNPGAGNEVQTLEVTASHELIEAATDADDLGTTAWKITDATSGWFGLGGEVGDQCEFRNSYYLDPTQTYWAQRVWSNTAALGNGSPCIPLPNAAADASPFYAQSISGALPVLTAGSSQTYTVQAWSNCAAPPWTAYIQQVSGTVQVQLSTTTLTMNNGDQPTFTVTVPSTASFGQYAVLIVMAYPAPGQGDTMFWPIEIGVL